MSTILAIDTSEATDMLHTKASSAIVLPDGSLTMDNEAVRPIVSALMGVGLNLVVLPHGALDLLQDELIAKMRD